MKVNPKGSERGSYRVNRGGGWYYYAAYCRAAYRGNLNATGTNFNLGFRVCLPVKEKDEDKP